MRWITFVIAGYLFVCAQFALGGLLRWGEATPNLVLVLLVFVALHARTRAALVAGFVAGLMHDVVAGHGLGTFALAYPLVVAVAVQLRDVLSTEHAVTHALVTLLLGTLVAASLVVRHAIRGRIVADDPSIALGRQLLGAVATTVASLPIVWLLRKARRAFGFSTR